MDDIIVIGINKKFIQQLIGDLHTIFSLKDFDDINYFFGIQIQHNRDSLHLNQHKHVMSLVTESGITSYKPLPTLMSLTTQVSKYDSDPLDDSTLYRQLVGDL